MSTGSGGRFTTAGSRASDPITAPAGGRHPPKAKGGPKHGNIWKARSGNRGGLEHFLPVLMTFGVHAGRIAIEDVARVGALNTAKVFGLYPRKGALIPGADADVIVVDSARAADVA